jgi:GNAT superfamily N-acetyltransferase
MVQPKEFKRDALRIEVGEDHLDSLANYADIPIAFTVARILEVRGEEGGEFSMVERAVATSSVKDYDAIENPRSWVDKVDVSNWAVFAARTDNRRVGGALIAFRTPGLDMLEGRDDLAVLWDIRVRPPMRRCGIGSALLEAVERWTLAHGGAWLKVETQNINVPACRFYARNGFTLRKVNANAYPSFPEEIQLLWYKELR